MVDNRRRSRTNSLPSTVNEEIHDSVEKIDTQISEEVYEETFNQNSVVQNSSLPFSNSATDSENTKSPSILGSIYSLGDAFWSFVRGPVETDSNNGFENASKTGKYQRNKSQSFSFSSPSTNASKILDDDSDFHSDSSDAPDFNLTRSQTIQFGEQQDQLQQNKILTSEPGRGKINFKSSGGFCNLIGRDFPENEHVLSASDISSIQSQIPARWNVYNDWILLYSTRGNGFSLTTLYHQLKPFKGPIIISVKDEFSALFGAFLNQSLQPRQGHYGNGECFLWTINNENTAEVNYTKYPSTGKNNYFIITEADYLAIGCGGGKFGLWLEKDLFKGTSEPVPTFDNEKLSTKVEFECIAIEIWGLDLNE